MSAQEPEGDTQFDIWKKKRIFVREVSGKYADAYRQLLAQPRVIKTKSFPFTDGPARFSKMVLRPQNQAITQAIECHIDVIAPGSYGQKHGHMNSAVFYILEGKGYDVHDGVRYDWEAGDACIVEDGCVHQHFNADPNHEVRALIIKAKPLFLFFNLLFQKNISMPPTEGQPGFEDWKPED